MKDKIKAAKYREAHREELAQKGREYAAAHRKEAIERARAHNKLHKEERKLYSKKYRETNKEKLSLQKKEYLAAHDRDKRLSYAREYYILHKEQFRKYAADHKEHKVLYRQKYLVEHREELNAKRRKYLKSHPEKRISIKQARRAKISGNGGRFTSKEWESLLEQYNHTCLCCGRNDVKLTADHVLPIVSGGSSNIDNIQPLCKPCNSRKNKKHTDYRPQYAQRLAGSTPVTQFLQHVPEFWESLATGIATTAHVE